MAFSFKGKKGEDVVLLNPAEKGRKFADELKNDVKLTNKGLLKFDSFGSPIRLTDTEKSYRSGYLAARKDSAKAYKSKQR